MESTALIAFLKLVRAVLVLLALLLCVQLVGKSERCKDVGYDWRGLACYSHTGERVNPYEVQR